VRPQPASLPANWSGFGSHVALTQQTPFVGPPGNWCLPSTGPKPSPQMVPPIRRKIAWPPPPIFFWKQSPPSRVFLALRRLQCLCKETVAWPPPGLWDRGKPTNQRLMFPMPEKSNPTLSTAISPLREGPSATPSAGPGMPEKVASFGIGSLSSLVSKQFPPPKARRPSVPSPVKLPAFQGPRPPPSGLPHEM